MKIGDVLSKKGRTIYSIGADALVSSAIAVISQNRIGSLALRERGGQIAGLVTEADLLTFLNRNGPKAMCSPVKAAMRLQAPQCDVTDAVVRVIGRMTLERKRHMIAMDNGRAVGIVSMGDLVKAQLSSATLEADVLRDIARARLLPA